MHAERPDGRADDRALLEEHAQTVGKACMAWLGEGAAAQAAVEEVFVQALEALAQPSAPGASEASTQSRGWLFGITLRVCVRRLEEAERARARVGADTRRNPGSPAERTRAALADLRPTERDAVILRCVAGLRVADVAAACGIDEKTARERLNKGLARLRALLADGK